MRVLRNEHGLSLVESLIALSVMAAAGVAYMTHVQTVSKNEAAQKVRQSLTLIESQAVDYLQSKEVCNDNLGKAFDEVVFNNTETVNGRPEFKKLKNRGFKDEHGNTVQVDIFDIDKNYEGDRIWVKDISYKVEKLQTIAIKNAPWNRAGTLKIAVEFETCSNGGPVYRVASGGGPKQVACTGRIVTRSKVFTKMAAFKLDANNKIEKKFTKTYNQATQKWENSTTKKMTLACADSQDALVDAAREYTDQKVCKLEALMYATQGVSGVTACGHEVVVTPVKDVFGFGSSKKAGSIQLDPNKILKGSVKITASGGGGGGGGGDCNDAGAGGTAGASQTVTVELSEALTCSASAGKGGNGGQGLTRKCVRLTSNNTKSGSNGSASSISCSKNIGIPSNFAGGNGGKANAINDVRAPTPGQNSAIGGVGGLPTAYGDNGNEKHGGIGAGGGGGGYKRTGGNGGEGIVSFEYTRVDITQDGVSLTLADLRDLTVAEGP